MIRRKVMADKDDIFEDNVGGQYIFKGKRYSFYVDKECIFCHECTREAPSNFAESEEADHDYVYKQPESEQELNECLEAMDACPVDSIGYDRQR
jgi:ferredoxin